jgi:2,4-dienoyl-CoA reductase-like NADH-dependent reductase (Old Yellow Enzyme family)
MYNFLQPYTFKNGSRIANRIVMAPITTKSSFYDGSVTIDELKFYQRRSGVGMIITAAASINDRGRGFEGQLSVADDALIPSLRKLAGSIKSKGSKAILQLFSAGRMTNTQILRGQKPQSASAIPALRPQAEVPEEMSEAQIEQVIDDFVQATRRAILAGFDGIELQGANTYLLQQFFSPHSNRRNDQWGGSLKKRMKLPLTVINETYQAIRRYARQPFILGYRFSPEEIETPGIRLTDTLKLVDELAQSPIDYLHTSLGKAWRSSINGSVNQEPINQQFLRRLKNKKPLIVTGGLCTPQDIEATIKRGATFAAMARELLREPEWLLKVQNQAEATLRYQLNLYEMDELALPHGLQTFLRTDFADTMNFKD